jgi:hypothetical protein
MQHFFSLLSWRLFTAQHVSGVLPSIIRSSMTAVAASGYTFVLWWQSCCVRGRTGRPDHEHSTNVESWTVRSWVLIPPGAWMFVCCECCLLSGRGLCDELITRPEEFYRLWCVVVCDLETSRMRRPWHALGRSAKEKKGYKITVGL